MTTDHVPVDTKAVQELREAFHGRLVLPEDEAYEGARQIWNGMIDKHPAVIARCMGVADVVTAVTFAREHDLLTAIRGGGHNVAGSALCDDGIVIDLSAMRGVLVDPETRTARAQAGATWGDVDRETQVFGLIAPGGIVSETGIAGLTLGGGYSHTRRKYGLTIDNLRSVEIVTAAGEVLTASEDSHEDLFWALRGGGGNFGVVTAFEYELHELGPEVMTAGPMYPFENAPTLLRKWRDYSEAAPDEVTSSGVLWHVPDQPPFPAGVRGEPIFVASAVYAGPVEEGREIMQPLRDFDDPLLDTSGAQSYLALQTKFDPFLPAGDRYFWKSRYLADLSDDAIDTAVEQMTRCPSPRTIVTVRARGGAIARVDPAETAFPDRDSPYMISIDSTWTDPADDEANVEWTREFWAAMEPFSSAGVHLNFAMAEGEDVLRATFGENYERLVAVKNTYDPENLFRVNQNIRPNTDRSNPRSEAI